MSAPEKSSAAARYQAAAQLFLEVCDLPPRQRERILDARCAAAPSLREEVDRLLENDVLTADESGFSLRPSLRIDLELDRPGWLAEPWTPGTEIGPYRLVGVLGEGGMGVVYLAEQTSPIRREVALKLARRHRALIATTLAVCGALGVGTGASLLAWHRAARERVTAETQRAEALRLSDVKKLSLLWNDAQSLLGVTAGKRAAIDAWLARARALARRAPMHRESLRRLRALAAGRRSSPASRTGTGSLGGTRDGLLELTDSEIEWQRETLVELVEGLDELASGDARQKSIARVESWRERAPGQEEISRRWERAVASIADPAVCPKYGGLRIRRQKRLIPWHRNETSGLWEFVDAGTGLLPRSRATGSAAIDAETGVVFVLLPGGSFTMGSARGEHWRVEEEYKDRTDPALIPPLEIIVKLLLRAGRFLIQRHPRWSAGEKARAMELLVYYLMPEPLLAPPHEVVLSPFFLSKYELTQSVWVRFAGNNPSSRLGPRLPVHSLTWEQAAAFCRSSGLELPTEAQWEYACRAGTRGSFGGTGRIEDMGWSGESRTMGVREVGSKRSNQFGLHDMHGNVREYCRDVYDERFYLRPEAAGPDPVCLASGPKRVVRGGGYSSPAWSCHSGHREAEPPSYRGPSCGLRPARALSTR